MHVVYILSPDFAAQLYVSLRSLFMSGTTCDHVTIFSVGGDIRWDAGHLPITFRCVAPKAGSYWMLNKTYLCEVESDKLLFLDTDTIVQQPLDPFLQAEKDVIARRSTAYTLPTWDENAWKDYLTMNRVTTEIPVLNAGLLLFRGGIHKRIESRWAELMRDAWHRRLFGNGYHADQWSLPVALGQEGATYTLLEASEHAFAWEGDSPEGAAVYHTGASNFFGLVRHLEEESFMGAELPIPRPNVLWHHMRDRLKRKLRWWLGVETKTIKPHRDDSSS